MSQALYNLSRNDKNKLIHIVGLADEFVKRFASINYKKWSRIMSKYRAALRSRSLGLYDKLDSIDEEYYDIEERLGSELASNWVASGKSVHVI